MHHHHFIITKLLLLIGILVGVFYAFNYIKERYQAYQAYQVKKVKMDKSGKSLKGKNIESVGNGSVNEERELKKEGRILKEKKKSNKTNKACFVYLEWEDCGKK